MGMSITDLFEYTGMPDWSWLCEENDCIVIEYVNGSVSKQYRIKCVPYDFLYNGLPGVDAISIYVDDNHYLDLDIATNTVLSWVEYHPWLKAPISYTTDLVQVKTSKGMLEWVPSLGDWFIPQSEMLFNGKPVGPSYCRILSKPWCDDFRAYLRLL